MTSHQRLRGRPAHPPGPTFLAYSPNGRKLVTAGINNVVRVYETGSDGEPANIDDCQENNTAVAATNDLFLTGSEDGTVCMYSLETNNYEKMMTRCTLPIRDIALSPDGKWAAIASDELTIKLVNMEDMLDVVYLRDCPRPAKHLSWDPSGTYLAASCTDGIVYLYRLGDSEPELERRIDDVIRVLETDAEATSLAAWHPDGRAFAAPTAAREVQVVSIADGEKQRVFAGGHSADITELSWSPNGALLATAGADGKLLLWDNSTQKVLATYDYPNVTSIRWHPTFNLAAFTTSDGEVFMFPDVVPADHISLLTEKALHPAPFIHDPLGETSHNIVRRPRLANGIRPGKEDAPITNGDHRPRAASPDELDQLLGSDAFGDEEEDFVVDDDGAGYALNANGKRTNGHLENYAGEPKRLARWEPQIHEPFQTGSTPWRGNRRYLCLNLIGSAWTVDQGTHHTVTVEFYDRELYRDFHFTDPYLYDKACLNENGTLFSCDAGSDHPAQLFYRPHETWSARTDWRIKLPEGEAVTSIALSDSFIVACTTAPYVRIYTLHGTPLRIHRPKSAPIVTCAVWRDYVLTVGNGPVDARGRPRLHYALEHVRRDEACQSEDVLPLPGAGAGADADAELRGAFFSDRGDPCAYDGAGVLLVLQHWRAPGAARWVPLLDTRRLARLASGRKAESYWPVAVARDKFHCIILKGGDRHPYFPRPLLSEFDFEVPVAAAPRKADGDGDEEMDGVDERDATARLEEAFVRGALMHSLAEDRAGATRADAEEQRAVTRAEVEVDKTLLQLINAACRDGDEQSPRALELAKLLRDGAGRMVEAAAKIAARYERWGLEKRVRDEIERRAEEEAGEEDGD